MRPLALAIAVVLVTPSQARADEAFAVTAFEQAETLRKQNKWPEACKLYAASYDADPQLGVLLHLADCNEHIGNTATAWARFGDAADLAHRASDPRERIARKRADALAKRLSKLHVTPPQPAIPGLVLRRDGTDITTMIGADLATDPGTHELVASAPGYVESKAAISIGGEGTITQYALPALAKVPEVPVEIPAGTPTVPPATHNGTVKITTITGATILVDSKRVATGSYAAKLESGVHELRVVAQGMLPYEHIIVIRDNEETPIDVALERKPVVTNPPSFEIGASIAPGRKLRNERPGVVAYRAELAFRIGTRVNFGAFLEYGSIAANQTCGFDMPGPMPVSGFDYGTRNQMTSCSYLMPGVQLYLHVLARPLIDPYLGITPAYRFGFASYTPYYAATPAQSVSEGFSGIVIGARAGIDVHPASGFAGWGVGPFVDTELTISGKESCEVCDGRSPTPNATFLSVLIGLRSSVAF